MAKWTKREIKKLREDASPYPWDDLRFPLTGARLDSGSTRYSYDFFNGGITFDDDSRYTNEVISMLAQLPHEWLEEDNVRLHLHWLQAIAGGNWLLAYKIYKNGETAAIDANYNNHTFLTGEESFTYSSGTIVQITDFGEIAMKGVGLSDMIHMALWKDTDNESTLFAGSDANARTALELDIHYRKRGSYVDKDGANISEQDTFLGSYFEYQHLDPKYRKQYNIDK